MAGHRSPTGRARTGAPRSGTAPRIGPRRTVTGASRSSRRPPRSVPSPPARSPRSRPGAPAAADPVAAAADADAGPSPVLAASAGVLQPAERLRTLAAPAPMLPVAHVVDDEAVDERVASVQKASRLAEQHAPGRPSGSAPAGAEQRAAGWTRGSRRPCRSPTCRRRLRPGRQKSHHGRVRRQPAGRQHLGQQRPAGHPVAGPDADHPVDVPALRASGGRRGRSPTRWRTSRRGSAT